MQLRNVGRSLLVLDCYALVFITPIQTDPGRAKFMIIKSSFYTQINRKEGY